MSPPRPYEAEVAHRARELAARNRSLEKLNLLFGGLIAWIVVLATVKTLDWIGYIEIFYHHTGGCLPR